MIKNINRVAKHLALACSIAVFASCVNDLDTKPIDPNEISQVTPENAPGMLAKIYSGFTLTGQEGPGSSDIVVNDAGKASFLRRLFVLQELPTDEVVCFWGDVEVNEMNTLSYTANNEAVRNMYDRINLQIGYANEFLRQTSGIDDATLKTQRAEARFLRALTYYYAMDLFANMPFTTEADPVGAFNPEQKDRTFLFDYIEAECKAVIGETADDNENILLDAKAGEIGRADKAAAWMLLARIYLNAEVYINTPKYTEAITYLNQVFSAGYSLEPVFADLFKADNYKCTNEIIFSINQDGIVAQTFGGTTYMVAVASGGDVSGKFVGTNGGWQGNIAPSTFVNKFDNLTTNDPNTNDARKGFFITTGDDGTELDIDVSIPFEWGTEGYKYVKWTNIVRGGTTEWLYSPSYAERDAATEVYTPGRSNGSTPYTDINFPLFRLGDANLMYAEAVLRGGTGGTRAEALQKVNDLRTRAKAANILDSDLDLDFILDERSRELAWEAQRRSDLIRFGVYTKGYNWPYKGGALNGQDVDDKFKIYPLPFSDIGANPNLKQNPGY
ncbi:RagB/SusD family nutrient uptake outer membrane protein [Flammeovirga sp. EKP202]|uniref:RagB/SusD family nutrient uptake outer membrane protein n=1 Tax=Flammeovirga sp. EKP202 TaxID=2770592 RepID=UPI00165EE618|nr:RagB/SusD family nutrient uptake outer membrane protein [Flammeovirga sp. EKP202]MBD0403856.1 RagB/SusD family nutrient uptake outer membrane protein [Flammeovirga sp. EKP202]